MEKILFALKNTMNVPTVFGAFHLVTIAAVIVVTVLLCVFFRDANNKTYRIILLIIWSIMATFEVIKHFICSYDITADNQIIWGYDWAAFPLQLCSFPLYVLPFVACLKDGKVREALSTFSFTFLLLGGVAVMATPATVFKPIIFLNIQTMLHHGLQIASGIFIAVHNRKNIRLLSFLYAVLAFIAVVIVAQVFNVVMHAIYPEPRINMLFISPYFKKNMPIFSDTWAKIHWVPAMLLYIAALSALSFIIFMIFYAIFFLLYRRKKSA